MQRRFTVQINVKVSPETAEWLRARANAVSNYFARGHSLGNVVRRIIEDARRVDLLASKTSEPKKPRGKR
jgi:hypothetical protein